MEKLIRPKLEDLPALKELKENWQLWGDECKAGKKKWRSDTKIYYEIRNTLEKINNQHCSFCDDKPLGVRSKKTIEHYFPKGKDEFPCLTFSWENLFYCCDMCQSNSNKLPFEYTLKPDNEAYSFEDYFYYDTEEGELKVLENLIKENSEKFEKATAFLKRYGLTGDNKLRQVRKDKFIEVFRELKDEDDTFDKKERDDFAFRFVYDAAKEFYENWKRKS